MRVSGLVITLDRGVFAGPRPSGPASLLSTCGPTQWLVRRMQDWAVVDEVFRELATMPILPGQIVCVTIGSATAPKHCGKGRGA